MCMDSGSGQRAMLEYSVRRRRLARYRSRLVLSAFLVGAAIVIPILWRLTQPFIRQHDIVAAQERFMSRPLPSDVPLLETDPASAAEIFLYRDGFHELRSESQSSRARFTPPAAPPPPAFQIPASLTVRSTEVATDWTPSTQSTDDLQNIQMLEDFAQTVIEDQSDQSERKHPSTLPESDDILREMVQLAALEARQAEFVPATRPAAAYLPSDINVLISAHYPVDRLGAVVFAHEVREPRGAHRWLVVTATWYANQSDATYVLELTPFLFEPATMRPGSSLSALKNYTPKSALFAVGPRPDFRVFAGEMSPTDPSAFQIDYVIGRQRGTIAGTALDNDSVSLLHISGPAYSVTGR